MFASIRICAKLIILLISAPSCYGQTTVWLSDSATFADLDITTALPPGTTGSFDIWIKTEQPDRHDSIDLHLMSIGNAIRFTDAKIVIGEDRFRVQGHPMVLQNGVLITDMFGFSGIGGADLGTGIGPGVPVDDDTLGAYRFATIQYRIVSTGISELQFKVGDDYLFQSLKENTLHLGIGDPTSQNMPGGTDTMIDGRIQVVPEANSVVLLFIGGSLLLMGCLNRWNDLIRSNIGLLIYRA